MTQLRCSIAAVLACAFAFLALAGPAAAHQSPAGCNTSGLNVLLNGVGFFYRNGDELTVVPRIRNDANNVCDVTDATVTIAFPKPDGTPGPAQVVATGLNLPAGTAPMDLPAVKHTIDLNPNLLRGEIEVKVTGIFHWIGTHNTPGFISGLGQDIVITRPHATVTVTPTTSGDAPQPVTYKYEVKNDSPHDAAPGAVDPSLFNVELTDDRCGPIPATHTGDTNANNDVDPGETWTYTCMSSPFPSGTFKNHVSLSGVSSRDGRAWPTATGEGTVTVNGPDMTLAKSHTGDFHQGDTDRTYSLLARNSGNRPASGPVSVTDTLPAGLSATAIAGTGWDCTLATLTCTRSDALAAGEAYPPITVTVDVASAAPASVTNKAKVTRAGEDDSNDSAEDVTPIGAPLPPVVEEPGSGSTEEPGGGTGDQPGGGQQPQDNGTDTPPRDTTAPAFSGLRVTNRVFAVDASRVGAARAKKGTVFAYTLTEAAHVTFTVERKSVGRRSRGHCVKQTKRNAKGKRCSLFQPVGSFTQDAAAGQNSRRWFGTVGSKVVKPGTYRAAIVATDAAANKSAPKRVGFKVVKR
jgi:hypothetical protein